MKATADSPSSPTSRKTTRALACLLLVALPACNSAQMQQLAPALPAIGAAAGGIIGHQTKNAAAGAVIGGLFGYALQQAIESTARQREAAVSSARYAYNRDRSFKEKYTTAKKSGNVECMAVRVKKDPAKPESKDGFMLYDPSRGSLVDNKVYTGGSRASGTEAQIGGKRAMIYSGAI